MFQRCLCASLRVVCLIALSGSAHAAAPSEHDAEACVTVTGERPGLVYGNRDATAASSVLLRTDLEAPGATSANVLARVPGVTVLRRGSGDEVATASLRGTESRQVPIYLAGIRLNDDVSGSADLSTIPLWMVQRVEVYRGNSPETADRSGLAGAIFFEPLRPTQPEVGANVALGSYGERAAWLRAATGNERASTLIAVRYSQADNDYEYVNDFGQRFDLREARTRRRNADYRDVDVWSLSNYTPSARARVTVLLNALQRDQGAASVATAPAELARNRLQRLLAGATVDLGCELGHYCRVSLTASGLATSAGTTDPALELRISRGTWVHQQGARSSGSARWVFRPVADLELRAAAEHIRETLTLRREAPFPRDALRNELSGVVNVVAFPDRALTAQVLTRARCTWAQGSYEFISNRVEQSTNTCTGVPDARLGVRYRLHPNLALLANAAHVTQQPNLGELYGIHPSVSGNPKLQPEQSNNFDVGVRAHASNAWLDVDVDAFAFARFARNLIRYQQTSLNTVSPFNESAARIYGAEATLSARVRNLVHTRTSVTALDPRRVVRGTTSETILPFFSRLTLSQELGARYAPNQRWLDEARLLGRYFHSSSRYFDESGLVVLPEQRQLDVELQLGIRRPDVTLRASIENITNRRNIDLLGFPLPGISYHASLEANWK